MQRPPLLAKHVQERVGLLPRQLQELLKEREVERQGVVYEQQRVPDLEVVQHHPPLEEVKEHPRGEVLPCHFERAERPRPVLVRQRHEQVVRRPVCPEELLHQLHPERVLEHVQEVRVDQELVLLLHLHEEKVVEGQRRVWPQLREVPPLEKEPFQRLVLRLLRRVAPPQERPRHPEHRPVEVYEQLPGDEHQHVRAHVPDAVPVPQLYPAEFPLRRREPPPKVLRL